MTALFGDEGLVGINWGENGLDDGDVTFIALVGLLGEKGMGSYGETSPYVGVVKSS